MNLFTQYRSLEKLNQIALEKDRLLHTIEETGGYILYLMEQFKIKPPVDFFFNDNSVPIYAVSFISNNYPDLTLEQKRVLTQYQNYNENYNYEEGKYEVEESSTEKESHDIEYYLQNKLSPPKNAVITFELINHYHKEISQILDNDGFVMERILKPTMKDFTLEQFFALDKDFVKSHPYFFNWYPKYFANNEFKHYFKESILESDNRLNFHHFENYLFEQEDRELLFSLIKGKYSVNYDDIAKLHGASQLISKKEFFETINPKSITYFSDEETLENKELIQKIWKKGFDKKYRHDYFSELISTDSSIEQFRIIVNQDYFDELVNQENHVNFNSVYKEDYETKKKIAYIKNLSINYLLANPKQYKKFSISGILHDLFENFYQEEVQNKAQEFYKIVIPEMLKEHGFLNMTGRHNSTINDKSIAFIKDLVKAHPSINLLYVLLDTHDEFVKADDFRKKALIKEVKSLIDELIPLVHAEDAKVLVKAFKYKKSITTLYNNTVARDSFETNFLNHGYNLGMEWQLKHLVFQIDKTMFTHILKHNVVLSDEDYSTILKNSEEDKDSFSFIKKYTEKNKTSILDKEELVRKILSHSRAQEIIEIDNSQEEKDAYSNYIQNYDKIRQLKKLKSQLNSQNDAEKDIIYKKESVIEKENTELEKKISLAFVEEKTQELIKNHDFQSLKALSKIRLFNIDSFNDYVYQLPFDKVNQFVENEAFMSLIVSQSNYNGETKFSFGQYSEKETYQLALKVLNYFKNEHQKDRDLEKIIPLFQRANQSFFKEFFIENLPNNIFYSYKIKSVLGKASLTNDEILKAYINAEKTNFFSDMDVNAHFSHTLRDFFENNKEQYLDMLEKVKNTYPKFYLLLTHHDISSKFYEWGDGVGRDEAFMKFYVEHFDMNAIKNGIGVILDEIKNCNHEFYNAKLASHPITQAIYSTYYDKDNSLGQTEYFSLFTQEQTHNLLHFIWHKAPLFILDRYHIGNINNIADYIVENFKEFDSDQMPLAFLYPDFNVKSDSFNLKGVHSRAGILTIFNGMMDYYMKSNQPEKIDLMIYLVERAKYFTNKINYGNQPENLHLGSWDSIIEIIHEDDATMDKIKNYKLKSMLDNTIDSQEVKPKKSKKI